MEPVQGTIHSLPEEIVRKIGKLLPLAEFLALRWSNRFFAKSLDIKLCLRLHLPLFEEFRKVGGDEFAFSMVRVRSWKRNQGSSPAENNRLGRAWDENVERWANLAVTTRNGCMLALLLDELKRLRSWAAFILKKLGQYMSVAAGNGWLSGVMSLATTMELIFIRNQSTFPPCQYIACRSHMAAPEIRLIHAFEEPILVAASYKHLDIVDYIIKDAILILQVTERNLVWFAEFISKLTRRVDHETFIRCVEIGRIRGALTNLNKCKEWYPSALPYILDYMLVRDDPSVVDALIRTHSGVRQGEHSHLLLKIADVAQDKLYPNVVKEAIRRLESMAVRDDCRFLLIGAITMLNEETDPKKIEAQKEILRTCLHSPMFAQHIPDAVRFCVEHDRPSKTSLTELLAAFPDLTRARIRSLAVFPDAPRAVAIEFLLQHGFVADSECCEELIEEAPHKLYLEDEEEVPVVAETEDLERLLDGFMKDGSLCRDSEFNGKEFPGILEALVRHGLEVRDEVLVRKTVRNCVKVGKRRVSRIVIGALRRVGAVVDEKVIRDAVRKVAGGRKE
ncbi:hypothetical protein HDV00_011279 [Rhizophlyctis rosea]|nr:hypothetical protein HDV00_011279 [Rhizophlyctis rosea]